MITNEHNPTSHRWSLAVAEMFDSTLSILERIPAVALKIAAPLILIGGGLVIAMKIGFIAPTAFSGYLADIAPAMVTVGVSVLVVGVLYALTFVPGKISGWRRKVREKTIEQTKLQQNLRFAAPESLLMLYAMMQQPDGRMPNIFRSMSFSRLQELGLIQGEGYFSGQPSTLMRVNPVLYDCRADWLPDIKSVLDQHFSQDFSVADNVRSQMDTILRREGRL